MEVTFLQRALSFAFWKMGGLGRDCIIPGLWSSWKLAFSRIIPILSVKPVGAPTQSRAVCEAGPEFQSFLVFHRLQSAPQPSDDSFNSTNAWLRKSAPNTRLIFVCHLPWNIISPTNSCCLTNLNAFKWISFAPSRLSSCSRWRTVQTSWLPLLETEFLPCHLKAQEQSPDS